MTRGQRVLRRPPEGWGRGGTRRARGVETLGAILFLSGLALAQNLFFRAACEFTETLLNLL